MAGRGRPPKDDRINTHELVRGAPVAAETDCWSGDIPEPPDGLMQASIDAWNVWFGAWFAAHWSSVDLPGLRQLVRLYDQVERGEFQRAGELRIQMDTYGITPKGQQDRRWKQLPAPATTATSPGGGTPTKRYGHLRTA